MTRKTNISTINYPISDIKNPTSGINYQKNAYLCRPKNHILIAKGAMGLRRKGAIE